MAGQKHNMAPIQKKPMKDVDLDEPTSFVDHVYLGCTQRECEPNEGILQNTETCASHVFPLEQPKHDQNETKIKQVQQHGPTTWRDTPKSAW